MRMRKRIDLFHLSLIFDRSLQRMGQIVDMWTPMWGAAGLDCSELEITTSFLNTSLPKDYKDQNMENIAA